jgi:hypothetical protein
MLLTLTGPAEISGILRRAGTVEQCSCPSQVPPKSVFGGGAPGEGDAGTITPGAFDAEGAC